MKIAIVAPSPIPFGPGGAEAVWAGLYHELMTATSHDVELIKVPVRETTLPEVMDAYAAFARLDLSHFDLVITGKYPAWMIEHPRHVVYMLHPLRGLYDSYHYFGQPLTVTTDEPHVRDLVVSSSRLRRKELPELFGEFAEALHALGPQHEAFTFPGALARTLVHALDRVALAPGAVSRFYAISRTVAERADYFPAGADVTVVHPPSDLAGLHEEPGEYFFTASRHDAPKRLDVLVQAMAHYPGSRRLVIAGSGPETARLQELAAGDDRIQLVGRVSQDELVGHYAHALGVPFLPIDEDLGLITFEAMRSGKPVLTASDSGGPTEFVRPGVNGVVVAPTPQAVGRGLVELEELAGRARTADLARRSVAHISWSTVARALLESEPHIGSALPARRDDGRPRLVVTSTFPIWPPRNGGQLRAYHLYGALAEWFDVDLVCLAPPATVPTVRTLAPGLVEHVVPKTAQHEEEEQRIAEQAALPITDIVAGRLAPLTPDYGASLRQLLVGAGAVLLADPFLHPAVVDAGAVDVPVVYDAYNCELELKAQMLPPTSVREELLEEVRRVEGGACRAAKLVLTVSEEDRAQLNELYGVPDERFAAAPNGVDLDSVPYTRMDERARHRVRWLARLRALGGGRDLQSVAIFVGSWHMPNIEAADAITAMAPSLPEVAFVLMGSHTGALRRRALPRNVFRLGVVSDAAKLAMLATADVALAPLTTGSGTNLKVVEYLAAGVPVVSTAVGVRGLDVPRGSVHIADLAGFPSAIRAVIADAGSADDRSVPARLAVQRSYDWHAVAGAVRGRLEAVVSR